MEARDKIKHTRLALEVMRESEAIWLRLAVSIRSGESADTFADLRLEAFFRSFRRNLLVELVNQCLKMACIKLSKAIMKVIRAFWLKITKVVKVNA